MKKHAMEVQKVQLEQMKQNELRKETERETDKFYAAVTMKNQQAQVSVIYVIIVTCWFADGEGSG